ncbi:unnamed protein product [Rotaria magnacalcarata]|uniref:EGF-like domain-containing protein n=1 Tax=Rotaria magnacalcarata TaxID=392030 RepID=A0A816W053_9BILA|nr:unnamed protein product [Rotaria magnacalcarata]CAF2131150.1 unnamed protein product [Rotaria magnacalcarata]CAF3989385.1 unnamed protein product [Rotaria magnacalcarata]CAF4065127.1 unnamed protein product [Rotaria magnacalcarata]
MCFPTAVLTTENIPVTSTSTSTSTTTTTNPSLTSTTTSTNPSLTSTTTSTNPSLTSTTTTESWTPTSIFECQNNSYIGTYCNITNDPCEISQPCENQGTCYLNKTHKLRYMCRCRIGYSGDHCEHDNIVCKSNTCWHDGQCVEHTETVAIDNRTTFECRCEPGYDGSYCELVQNMCINITCKNNGVCFSSHLEWKCRCLDPSLYSGQYCEQKSALLQMKQALSKSFASVAIAAIITVVLFVFIMDILKYVFKIDPVDRERRLMQWKRTKRQLQKPKKQQRRKVSAKLYYIS